MKIALIGNKRIKSVESSPDFKFFATLTSESVVLWNTKEFINDLAENETDLMVEVEPHNLVKRDQRLTACSITLIKEFVKVVKKPTKKTKEIQKPKTEVVYEKNLAKKAAKKLAKKLKKKERQVTQKNTQKNSKV